MVFLRAKSLSNGSSAINNSSSSNSNEGNWGMGLLFVFFHHNPDEDPYSRERKRLSSPFSLSSPSKPSSTSRKAILSRTQSTLSICGLLVLATILLFTLSTLEQNSQNAPPRRALARRGDAPRRFSIPGLFAPPPARGRESNFALQGMGALYRRGSRAMTDLVVGHVPEGAEEREAATFLRLAHHSGLLSRADLVLVFSSPGQSARLRHVVQSESDAFLALLALHGAPNATSSPGHVSRYLRHVAGREGPGEEEKETVWGRRERERERSGNSSAETGRASYGSVVGFEAGELDPEGSLAGFLDRVPMGLRRWACYPMLLGRLRRYFKHTMLVDVGNTLILSDPFSRVRNRSTESVFLWPSPEEREPARHGKRREKATHNAFNPGAIVGGSRGVRRFSNALLTEIVRTVIEHKGSKGKASVSDSALVSQLVHNGGHLLKNVNVMTSGEPVPEASSLAGFNPLDSGRPAGFLAFSEFFSVVQRGNSKSVDIDSVIRREICSSHELYSAVYRDCLASH